ncbi:nucleotidyltransferase family protein [uncultured Maribacter sp.]|uniref:nucleotidyltransferase family protein n=1 Tax=uncultured Maribacter sp. TaxID=431308 RepID=UPI002614C9C3|nr:nucleotidyltransferase family protein [uncultured Maribacter sp.]
MKKELHIAVLVMAAGASRRMNGIKQLMPWKDSNFLLETIKTVEKSNAASVHVVLGSNAKLISRECNLNEKNIYVIVNPNWSNGLGNSIAYGVKALSKKLPSVDAILICLADQPLLDHNYLNSLINVFENNSCKIAATNYGKKIGVPALFSNIHFQHLSQLEGDFGAKELLNNDELSIISLEALDGIIDIDTKLEYNELINRTNAEIKP